MYISCWSLPSALAGRRNVRAIALALVLGTVLPTLSQAQVWKFVPRSYFDPLIAGVREPHASALGLALADRMAFMVEEDDPRQVWDIDLGVEIPIVGWESRRTLQGPERVPRGALGIGFWIPIDFHMIEDFADDSNPIINTDYRFGGMIKLQYGLGPEQWLGVRIFGGHESTHLGDEFSVVGQRMFPDTFERINVSWEFVDISLLYEAMAGGSPSWSARGGLTVSVKDSYYSTDDESVTESPIGPVTESTNRVDPYFGLEGEWEGLFGGGVGWSGYGSLEARWRSIYDYHKADPEVGEDRQLSVNVIAGVRKTGTPGALGRASPFLRFYRGVNPHGQFRNQRDYTQFGIGLRLTR